MQTSFFFSLLLKRKLQTPDNKRAAMNAQKLDLRVAEKLAIEECWQRHNLLSSGWITSSWNPSGCGDWIHGAICLMECLPLKCPRWKKKTFSNHIKIAKILSDHFQVERKKCLNARRKWRNHQVDNDSAARPQMLFCFVWKSHKPAPEISAPTMNHSVKAQADRN